MFEELGGVMRYVKSTAAPCDGFGDIFLVGSCNAKREMRRQGELAVLPRNAKATINIGPNNQ